MDDKKLLFIVNPRAGKTKSLAPPVSYTHLTLPTIA